MILKSLEWKINFITASHNKNVNLISFWKKNIYVISNVIVKRIKILNKFYI